MQVRMGVRHPSLRLLQREGLSHHGVFRHVAQELTQTPASLVLPESVVLQVDTITFRCPRPPPQDYVYNELIDDCIEIPGEEPPCPTELKSALDELKTLSRISHCTAWKLPQCVNEYVANFLLTVTEHTPEAGQAVATILQAGNCDWEVHRAFKSLPSEMQTHDHVIMVALENKGGMLIEEDRTGFFRANKRYVMQAIRSHTIWFRYACPTMYSDKEVILCYLGSLVRNTEFNRSEDVTWILSKVPLPFLQDRDIAMAAVKADGTSLKLFSDDLQDDRVLALIAVNSSALALRDVLPKFRKDIGIVLAAVQKYPTALQFAATHLRSDRHIVEEAIKKDGTTLQFADEVLKDDLMLAIQAIGQNPRAYHHISDGLKRSHTLVQLAATKCPQVLRTAPLEVRSNREVMAAIVSTHEVVGNYRRYDAYNASQYAIAYIDPVLQNDYDMAKVAVQTHGRALQHLPDKYRNSWLYAYWAIAQDPCAYRFIGDALKQSRDLAIQTVRHPKARIETVADYVLAIWYQDKALVLEAAKRSYPGRTKWDETYDTLILFRGREWTTTDESRRIAGDPDIVHAIIKVHGLKNLMYACTTLTNNRAFVSRILADYHEFRGRNNGILEWIGYELRQDMTTMLRVISKCTAPSVWLLHESLRNSVEFWERLLTMELRVANRQSLIDDIPNDIKEDPRIAPLLCAKTPSDQEGSDVPPTKKCRTM